MLQLRSGSTGHLTIHNHHSPHQKRETLNPTELNIYLTKNNIEKILSSNPLFWDLFCQCYAAQLSEKESNSFQVRCLDGKIHITGIKETYDDIKRTVRKIQEAFYINFKDNETFKIFAYIQEKQCHLNLSKDALSKNLEDLLFVPKNDSYTTYVKPILIELGKKLCVQLSESTESIKYKQPPDIFLKFSKVQIDQGTKVMNELASQNIEVLTFRWMSHAKFSYHIDPIPIPKRVIYDQDKVMYEKWLLAKRGCDVTLVSKDDDEYAVHSYILYAHGHELGEEMEEAVSEGESSLNLRFSSQAIEAFILYSYLGSDALLNEYAINPDFIKPVIEELLKLSYEYTILTLIDVCVNILSMSSERRTAEEIKKINEDYENPHLEKLYKALSKKLD